MEPVNDEKTNPLNTSNSPKKELKEDDIGDEITQMLEHYYQQSAPDEDDDDDDEEGGCLKSNRELLVFLGDSPLPSLEADEKRAVKTLPFGLAIKQSTTGSGVGVFTQAMLPVGVCFGPFDGEIISDIESPDKYCWEVQKDNCLTHYVNGRDESKANWLRYVKCASQPEKQNLLAFQYGERIYFKTTKDVPPDVELILQSRYVKHTVARAEEVRCHYSHDGRGYTLEGYVYKRIACDICSIPFNWLEDYTVHRQTHNFVNASSFANGALGAEQCGVRNALLKNMHNEVHANMRNGLATDLPIVACKEMTNGLPTASGSDEEPAKGTSSEEEGMVHVAGMITDVKRPNKDRQFCCHLCDKSFRHSSTLQEHVMLHRGEKPFKCSECTKCFTSVSKLNRHEKVHSGNRPHVCKICERRFIQASHLKSHIQIHTGRPSHQCTVCGKSYTVASSLNRHMLIHKDGSPFVCSFCGDVLYTAKEHEKHMRQHTGVKPYKCDMCGKGFCLPANLTKHTKLHLGEHPHECKICGKGFTHLVNMEAHVRVHLGEKPYECSTCDKHFTTATALTMHMKVHSGEIHKCPICAEEFIHSGNLKRHLAKSHSDYGNVENLFS